jgi:hypothetical protein
MKGDLYHGLPGLTRADNYTKMGASLSNLMRTYGSPIVNRPVESRNPDFSLTQARRKRMAVK